MIYRFDIILYEVNYEKVQIIGNGLFYTTKVDLSELNDMVLMEHSECVIYTDNLRLLLIVLNEEISIKGMDIYKKNINSYGKNLYELYDELIAQK